MSRSFSFTVPGPHRGKGRPRFGRGRVYSDPKDRVYEKHVQLCFLEACPGSDPLVGPLEIVVSVVKPRTKNDRGYWSVVKPDVSNVLKIIEDALNGLAYKDDSQIARATVSKTVGVDSHRVQVSIRELDGE